MESIIKRIEVADIESPLSVFVIDGKLHAVPHRTVVTQWWINTKKYPHVGIFNKDMSEYTVRKLLRSAI